MTPNPVPYQPALDPTLPEALQRNLIFVNGKGGVGKTLVSQALARALARNGGRAGTPSKKILWVTFEDPTRPPGEMKPLAPNHFELNCDASVAFEEYIGLKIGIPLIAKVFLQNKLIRYLSKAAPGLHELVLLGKVWHERNHFDHVVVDMPSTGYGLAMFQSTENFAQLFNGGPINRDAESMLATFRNPRNCAQLIVSLPEEMPLQESLDLRALLLKMFPENSPFLLVNRKFPAHASDSVAHAEGRASVPDEWPSPVPASLTDYIQKRSLLEDFNLRLWRQKDLAFSEIPYFPPSDDLIEVIAENMARWTKPSGARHSESTSRSAP